MTELSVPVGEMVAIRGSGRSHAGRARIRNIGCQECGIQIHPASVKFGERSGVCVNDLPFPANYERTKLKPYETQDGGSK